MCFFAISNARKVCVSYNLIYFYPIENKFSPFLPFRKQPECIVNNRGKWAKNGRQFIIKSLKMAQITQLFLLIFKNIQNWSKLKKFGPKTLILFAFSRHFFRASSSTESLQQPTQMLLMACFLVEMFPWVYLPQLQIWILGYFWNLSKTLDRPESGNFL